MRETALKCISFSGVSLIRGPEGDETMLMLSYLPDSKGEIYRNFSNTLPRN